MQTSCLETAKALLFQGDTEGVRIPDDLRLALELFSTFLRHSTGEEPGAKETAQFLSIAAGLHKSSGRLLRGHKCWMPSRNERVEYIKDGPWDTMIVRSLVNGSTLMVPSFRVIPDAIESDDEEKQQKAKGRRRETAEIAS